MLTALADLSSFASTNKLSKEALLAIGDINGDGEVTNADFSGPVELGGKQRQRQLVDCCYSKCFCRQFVRC